MTSTKPPSLAAMREALGANSLEGNRNPPALSEMKATLDGDSAFQHYGIKGMKWGIRRSDRELAKLRNEEGEEVGGVRTANRKEASRLRALGVGSAAVIDSDDGPLVVVKQKDGSFKQVRMSADAEAAVRTLMKDPVEMSTREMNDAVKRAQAIENYNKFFNPPKDPNEELKNKVDAMELQKKYSKAYAEMNPSKIAKVTRFVNNLTPIFDLYVKMDKNSNGRMSEDVRGLMAELRGKPAGGKHKAVKGKKGK